MGIKVEAIENGDKRRVTEDYTYPDGVTIPKGFVFDGASCPRIFWAVVAPFKHVTCSARHDWDCQLARQTRNIPFGGSFTSKEVEHKKARAKKIRKRGDKRYRKCKQERDSKTAGWLAWAGVRVGSFFGSGW